jgi:hypothetical protein
VVRAATGTTGGPNGSRGAESQEQTRLLEIQPLLQDQERKRVIVERGGSFTAQYIASRKLIVDAAQAKFFPCVVMAERQTSTFALARVVKWQSRTFEGVQVPPSMLFLQGVD